MCSTTTVTRCCPGIPGALVLGWLFAVGCMVPAGSEAQQEPPAATGTDALRSADIQQKFGEVAQYRSSGRYDLAVWTLEYILKSARIKDRQGEADDVAGKLALYEMESVTAALREAVPERLQNLERNDLARMTAVLRALDARTGGVDQAIRVGLPDTLTHMSGRLQPNLGSFERCLKVNPPFAQCMSDARFGTRTVETLQRAAQAVAAAMDTACAAGDAAAARQSVAQAEAERGSIARTHATATAWSKVRMQGAPLTCNGVTLDTEKKDLAALQRFAGEYDQKLEAFAEARAGMVAELDKALPKARTDLETLRRDSREVAAFIAAYKQGATHFTTPPADSKPWEARNLALLKDGEWELRNIEARRAALAAEDFAKDRERLARMRTMMTALEDYVRQLEDAVACADRVTVASAVHLAEADRALERSNLCLRTAAAREAVSAASAGSVSSVAAPPRAESPTTSPRATPATPTVSAPAGTAPTTVAQVGAPASAAANQTPEISGGLDIRGGKNRIRVGETVRFVATDKAGRPYPNVEWTSFEPNVLALDGSGAATGLEPGPVTLQAKVGEGLDARRAYLDVIVEAGTAAAVQPGPAAAANVPGDASRPNAEADANGQGPGFQEESTSSGPAAPTTTDGFTELGTHSDAAAASLIGVEAPQGAPAGAVFEERFEAPLPNVPGPGAGGSGAAGPGTQGPGGAGGFPAPAPLTTTAAAGQPAAYHIFAAGSRLGWASGLAQYSVGPADASIITDLRTAGEHVMWANRESYEPLRAWPNWSATRTSFNSWADELARTPTGNMRRQIPARAGGAAGALANEISAQMFGSQRVATANCDAAYMRLGYQLAYGQQVMMIADEAASQRNGEAAVRERADALSHLQTARQILIDYEQIKVVTGRCADLRDVRAGLEALLRLPPTDYSGQARSATATWQLALQRIAALRNVGPTPTPVPGPAPAPQPPVPARPLPATSAPSTAPAPGGGSSLVRLRTDGYYQARNPRGGLQFIRFLSDRTLRIVVMEYDWSGEMTGNPPMFVPAPREAQDRQAVWLLQQNPARWQDADSLDITFERQGDTIALRKNDPLRLNQRWFRIPDQYLRCNDFAELELVSESEFFLQPRCRPGYQKIPFEFVPHAW